MNEENQQYYNKHDDNWQLGNNTIERRVEPRPYRDKS